MNEKNESKYESVPTPIITKLTGKILREIYSKKLDGDQRKLLIHTATTLGPRYVALFVLMSDTGLNASVIKNLMIEDISKYSGAVKIHPINEGDKERVTHLSQYYVMSKILEYISPRTEGHIFIDPETKEPLTESTIKENIREIGEKAGFDNLNEENLYYTYIYISMCEHFSEGEIPEYLKHTDEEIDEMFDRMRKDRWTIVYPPLGEWV